MTSPDFEKHKNDMLLLLGGQNHIKCGVHRFPLIASNRKWNCSCNFGWKREHLRCSHPSCRVGLCKRCAGNYNIADVNYITCESIDPDIIDDDNSSSNSDESENVHEENFDNFSQNNDEESMSESPSQPELLSHYTSSDTSTSSDDNSTTPNPADSFSSDDEDNVGNNFRSALVDRLPSDYESTDSNDGPPGLIDRRYGITYEERSSDTSFTVGSTEYSSSRRSSFSSSNFSSSSSSSSSTSSSDSSEYNYDVYAKKQDDKDNESGDNWSIGSYDHFGVFSDELSVNGSIISNSVMNEEPGVRYTDGPDIVLGEIPDTFENEFDIPMDTNNDGNDIPTTDAGNERLEITAETAYGGVNDEFRIGGSGLLIEATNLLTRKNYNVGGTRQDKFFVQRFCATTRNTSVPLLWPEATMFPGIFYTNASDGYSIAGALPSPLLNVNCTQDGFCSIPDHIRTRLTNPGCSTSSDPRYIAFLYDVMSYMAANFNDTRMFSRHGLQAAGDDVGGLEQRGKGDSSLNNAVDSRQQVLNLCSSLGYFQWDFFLTFTCNQKKHFGTSVIRE